MTTIYDKFSLKGKTSIVTGGGGLLGKEFVKTLAEAGSTVYLADINPDLVHETAKSLAGLPGEVRGLLLDVTCIKSVTGAFERLAEQTGRLDVLVNSAALDPKFDPDHPMATNNAFEDYPLQLWQDGLNVNLTGVFLASQAASRMMVKQGSGSMINICSTYGLVGPDQRIYDFAGKKKVFKPVFYSVTKSGIMGMTRYLAAYYMGTQIRVNALTPGGVYNNNPEEFVKNYSSHAILGRMARKDEMNGALLFLASDASSYMTGSNVVVDGGWTAW
jgi:NAD(P)-dependent dehydrogenase (short-subunit alcohol dehydrogenase family)